MTEASCLGGRLSELPLPLSGRTMQDCGMAGGSREAGRTVTSKVLAILGAFDSGHPQLTLSDLARRSGVPLSTVHRLVGELEEWQALSRAPDGRLRIGLRLWELGQLAPAKL